MNTKQVLKSVLNLPGMPWGADVFFGRILWEMAEETKKEFVDVTHRFDPCKEYFVVWNRNDFSDFLASMPHYDLLITKGDNKQYAWEIINY